MATEKKSDKERSVEDRLKALYKLQTLLSEVDRIKILRGELPNEVKDLEDDIIRFQTRIQKYNDEIKECRDVINKCNGEIADRRAKIAKYEEQINNVRNNREFAFLEKEKEFETLEIELAEKHIRDAEAKIEAKTAEINATGEELSDKEHNLVDKKKELEEIVSETREQEEKLLAEAKEVEKQVGDDYTLNAFKRIRKNARNGLGIVTVQRNACGGCFNRIPPQRQLEIKMHRKVIVCEYCGRIMIDGALVGINDAVAEAPAKPKRASRKKAAPAAE
ncbi:MAG: hypothetical protein K2H86_08455 [Muribaculaceae bacterium]|nr:hypothetical protein [Muribaculaceae bacterium]